MPEGETGLRSISGDSA
jgi:hypothetical protein